MYGKSVFRVASASNVRYYKKDSTKRLLEFLAGMPKANSARIAEAQRQRQHLSRKAEKYEKYGPSTVYLQVLGSGARGVPNTLYLFTDQKRYLFNCGECTQRLAHEHKVKLSKLDHIFITSKTWKNIGGLPGLSLTLQDVGVPKITLHGPDGLDELYNATRRFVIMKDMQVTMAKCSPSEDFEDNVMTVKYVLLAPPVTLFDKEASLKPAAKRARLSEMSKEFEEFTHDDTDYYCGKPVADKKPAEKLPRPKTAVHDLQKKKTEKALDDLQMKSLCSVSYICTLKKRLGTLDLTKCVELGVKPGPLLGQLKAGHDVVLPDGTLVLSKDVKTPDDPGPVFIVLDVADISYLKESDFAAHFDNGVNPVENIPTLIVHLSPPHVFHHPTYQAFLTMFGSSTRHLILNAQNSCLGSEAVHRTQHKLHLLDPDIFPLLRDASVPTEWNPQPPTLRTDSPDKMKGFEDLKNRIAIAQFQNIINMESQAGDGAALTDSSSVPQLETYSARTLTMFHLRPKKQIDRSAEPKLHVQDYYQETMDVDGFVGSLEQFRRLVDGVRYAKTNSATEYPKIVFLGTGSCIPSKTRNTSGIMLHIDEKSSMLLDCGEGTFGQMVRFYGPRKVNEVLRTLKAIYISHLHADHHIGLIGVLQARSEAFLNAAEQSSPLYLLAPGQIVTWLTVYDQHFERITSEFTLIPNQSLLNDGPSELTSANLASIGVEAVRTCLVPHCPNAFGVALSVAGRKITYSGDTLPSDKLVQIGENSTVLIHEATMEDELADEARKKMHSTTSQAIDIGRQMSAQYTVLTHFSQRYARLPRLSPHMLHDNNTVGIAFDNMQITMNDLELLPHMYAPLQLMFAEHCVEMELKAAHRERRRERRTSSPSPSLVPGTRHYSTDQRDAVAMPTPPIVDQNSGLCERRQRVPSACGAVSAPPSRSHARYRESNSSRLRQQLRGVSNTGPFGPPAPRSKSSSPIKLCWRSMTNDSKYISSRTGSPDKIDLIQTPRTLSVSSSLRSLTRDAQDMLRIITNPPSCCTIDSQYKTLNNAHVGPSSTTNSRNSAASIADSKHSGGSRKKSVNIIPPANDQYKTINMTNFGPSSTTRNSSVTINDSKASADARKKYRSVTIAPANDQSKATSKANIGPSTDACKPINGALNKSGCVITAANAEIGYGKPLVTPLNKKLTIRRNLTPLSHTPSPPANGNQPPNFQRKRSPIRSWRAANSVIPVSKPAGLANKNHAYGTQPTNKYAGKKLRATLTNTYVKADRPVANIPAAASAPRPMSALLRRPNNSPGKSLIESANSQGSKVYRPQLEDIKSSFLLLNKVTKTKIDDSTVVPVPRPQLYNENKRKQILLESKLKFKSKHFWNDSSRFMPNE